MQSDNTPVTLTPASTTTLVPVLDPSHVDISITPRTPSQENEEQQMHGCDTEPYLPENACIRKPQTFIRYMWSIQCMLIGIFTTCIFVTGVLLWLIGFLTLRSVISSLSTTANNYLQTNVRSYTSNLMQEGPLYLNKLKDQIIWMENNGQNVVRNLVATPMLSRQLFYTNCHFNPSFGSVFYGSDFGAFQSVMRNDVVTFCPTAGDCYNNQFDNVTLQTGANVSRTTYNVTARPWYQGTKAKGSILWTSVYLTLFGGQTNNALAVTLSLPLVDNSNTTRPIFGALGITYDLTQVSVFLKNNTEESSTEVFIIDRDGLMVASSIGEVQSQNTQTRISSLNHTSHIVREATSKLLSYFGSFANIGAVNEIYYYDSGGYQRLVDVQVINDGIGVDWVIVTCVYYQGLLNYVNIMTLVSGLCSIATLFITVFISILFGCCITKPIHKVSKDMMKIAKGTFDSDTESDPMKIFTLREFREMSDSMAQMRMGLRNFEKYVPGDVVREMLRKNAGVELGVQPRFLTIMFLDIANFTTITEDMEPLQLVKLMSSFFTEMSQAVMQTGGTVDKFIGDCIMAFWNAPSEVASHEMRAVDATIDMMRRIQNMNKENPKLPLGIRIGVHTSQCLIGNVGSPARINYTALGDGVNLASRLEGINKRFGTTVCIGNTTYEAIGEVYLCRWLDYVSVKGKEEALDVYEVISRQENASEETKEWCALYNSMKNKLHERDYESVRRTCQAILETAPNRLQVRNDKPAELLLQRLNVESPSYNLVLLEK